MEWDWKEAVAHYRAMGAPGDQQALIALLREVQREKGGIPKPLLAEIAGEYRIKEALLLALIRRIPSLRLMDSHILEVCSGKNCGKRGNLMQFLERNYGKTDRFEIKYVPCMRHCGKGPNVRWDGTLYHQADEALIRKLVENR